MTSKRQFDSQFQEICTPRAALSLLAAALSVMLWCGCRAPAPVLPPRDLFASYSGEPEDWDHDGSPDGVIIKVTPLGAQGQPLKLSGAIRFYLRETPRPDSDSPSPAVPPLKSWEIQAPELEKHWVAGPLPGYVFRLDWGKVQAEGAAANLDIVLVPEVGASCQRTVAVRLR